MRKPWFEVSGGSLQLVSYLQSLESWQLAVADGQVTPEEIRSQGERVVNLLRTVEPRLTPAQRTQLTRIFYEMAVLQAMQTITATRS